MKMILLRAIAPAALTLLPACAAITDGLSLTSGGDTPPVEVRSGEGQTHPKARPEGIIPPTDAALPANPAKDENAKPAAGPAGRLGVTIASLGDPSQPGLWIKTPLIATDAKGRVHYGKTGKSVDVDLIALPGDAGAGSRLSLSAFQALGAPITGLPEIDVFRK